MTAAGVAKTYCKCLKNETYNCFKMKPNIFDLKRDKFRCVYFSRDLQYLATPALVYSHATSKKPRVNIIRKWRLQDLKLWIFTFEEVSIFICVIIASNGRYQGSMLAPITDHS
jgi:hypothetical protein